MTLSNSLDDTDKPKDPRTEQVLEELSLLIKWKIDKNGAEKEH